MRAAVHPDPYPYYAALVAGPALAFHPGLRLWVAASAAAVTEALEHPALRVRPPAEQVPRLIAGTPAGELFGHLVRMNDGPPHAVGKPVLQRALAGVAPSHANQRARWIAASPGFDLHSPAGLTRWAFEVPVSVTADLLGFREDELPQVAAWMADFVACLSPLSSMPQLAGASAAALALLERLRSLVAASGAGGDTLVARVQQEAHGAGWHNANAMLANLVGLLSQTYEATAGLVGNSLVALMTQPGARRALDVSPDQISQWVQETARHDPPVQNTRRFAAQDMQLCGVPLKAGDAVLLLLAAANRDPAANDRPQHVLLHRPLRRAFGFGRGRHACPGQDLAQGIATGAFQALLQQGPALSAADMAWTYRPSANARLPIFHAPAAQP